MVNGSSRMPSDATNTATPELPDRGSAAAGLASLVDEELRVELDPTSPPESRDVQSQVLPARPVPAQTPNPSVAPPAADGVISGSFQLRDVSVTYGRETALAGVTLEIPASAVTALIGPSGCGKSTLLRCLNRMNDELGNVHVGGTILLDGIDINCRTVDPVDLRRRVGQVFQKPNPFPMTIYDNVAYGPRTHGIRKRAELDDLVRESLERAALWAEVKNSLKKHAFELSGGQQQRLCIARALATSPEVLLMDEPASALDPISSQQIEDTIVELKSAVTIVIVTHNMQQAARISDRTAFMLRESMDQPAALIEVGDTRTIFTNPTDARTESYITGRFG